MKVNKFISLLIMIIFCSMLFCGCKLSGKGKTVVFIPQQASNGEYWDNIEKDLKKEATAAGYEYKIMVPKKWSGKEQEKLIEQAVKDNACAIVVAPSGTDELFPAFKAANKADIPIILIDTDIDRDLLDSAGVHITTFVGASNYDGGKQVADKVAEKLTSGDKVAILAGGADSVNGESRCNGFKDEMSKKGMNVVAELTTGWTSDDGYIKGKLILDSYPDLKAVFTVNSSVYKGVEQASDEYKIPVIAGSFDCDDETLKSINQGRIVCSFDQNSEAMSKGVINVINKFLKGETIESVTVTEGKLITK